MTPTDAIAFRTTSVKEARKQAAGECIKIVESYVGTDHICAEIAETFGLRGEE